MIDDRLSTRELELFEHAASLAREIKDVGYSVEFNGLFRPFLPSLGKSAERHHTALKHVLPRVENIKGLSGLEQEILYRFCKKYANGFLLDGLGPVKEVFIGTLEDFANGEC